MTDDQKLGAFVLVVLALITVALVWALSSRDKFKWKLAMKEQELANWMDTAAQFCRNEDYYRGLIDRCAAVFGVAARQCDDGISVSEDVLRAKVPLLVENMHRVLKNANDVCRSTSEISNREGRETNWPPFRERLSEALKSQHRILWPENYGPQPERKSKDEPNQS